MIYLFIDLAELTGGYLGRPRPSGYVISRHVVMVNVEAGVMVGAILAETTRQQDVIYSMAYRDQPAHICELVD